MPPKQEINRSLTIMLLPDNAGRARSLRLPLWIPKACLVIVLLAVAFGATTLLHFSLSYRQMGANMAELRQLRSVNVQQADALAQTGTQVQALQDQLVAIQQVDRTLRSELNLPKPLLAQMDAVANAQVNSDHASGADGRASQSADQNSPLAASSSEDATATALGVPGDTLVGDAGIQPNSPPHWAIPLLSQITDAGSSLAQFSQPPATMLAVRPQLVRPQQNLAAIFPVPMDPIWSEAAVAAPTSLSQGGQPSTTLSTGDSLVLQAGQLLHQAQQQFASLTDIQQVVEKKSQSATHYPDRWPVLGVITSPYGGRHDPFGEGREFHDGLDIAAPFGTPIHAAADGVVIYANWLNGFGRAVKISHGNGLVTLYGHQSRLRVHVGEHVKKGQIIGNVGSSGRSTGPHVHFTIYLYGHTVNPYPYLTNDKYAHYKSD